MTLGEPNIFEDPFESLWIKISASIAFFCGLAAAIILCLFVFYQRQGYAENYQTVINQLVSFTCLLVSSTYLYFLFLNQFVRFSRFLDFQTFKIFQIFGFSMFLDFFKFLDFQTL